MKSVLLQGLVSSLALCASSMESSRREIGPWSLLCDRTGCVLIQAVADLVDPEKVWTKVIIRREDRNLRLLIITPPMKRPGVRTKIDDAAIPLVFLEGCDSAKCTFSGALKGTALVNMKMAKTLSVLSLLDRDEPGSFDFELDDLTEALDRLPNEI